MECSVMTRSEAEATSEPPKVESEPLVFCTFWLRNVLRATTACTFSTSQLPKVVRDPWCFVHFDLEMCFAPQRRALFRDLNLQKWREHVVLCTFWLRHVLRTTTACTFSTSQLPKVVREWCVLYILTWKCASRHNGVHFFDISTSKGGRETWCVLCTFWLGNVLRATTACTFSTSQLPKVVREWCALYILTWKCASRHNGVHFFEIWTSKSGRETWWCFVHFDFDMCFAPLRLALFRHLNFQKWSENGVFCTFWLGNALRATTACTFSTSQLPKVVRRMVCVCTFWLGNVLRTTTACNFSSLISPDVSAPARFSEPTFQPSGATKPRKTQCVSRLSYLFAHLHLLSSDLFSSDSSPCWLLFHLSMLSEVWLPNFLR